MKILRDLPEEAGVLLIEREVVIARDMIRAIAPIRRRVVHVRSTGDPAALAGCWALALVGLDSLGAADVEALLALEAGGCRLVWTAGEVPREWPGTGAGSRAGAGAGGALVLDRPWLAERLLTLVRRAIA